MNEKGNQRNVRAEALAFRSLLRTCAKKKDLWQGSKIHALVLKRGLLEDSSYIADALVSMYAKCGALTRAQELLNGLPVRDVFSWTALISGYALHGQGQIALNCYEQMQHEGLSPDSVTFISILKACGMLGAANKGAQVHHLISKQGLLRNNLVLGTALVNMYAKCGVLSKAHEVLKELPVRDVVSWSALITGYTQHGRGQEAMDCFEQMQGEGISPDAATFASILKACGNIGAVDKGEQIYDEISRRGLLRNNIVLGNALVDMYAKCGDLGRAQRVLEKLPSRDVISWNALIAGYVHHAQNQDALNCLEHMQDEGVSPDAVTFISILQACGCIGAADKADQIHSEITRQGLLRKNSALGNTLVNMYAKCGCFSKAQGVLEELPAQDVASWSALIAGYTEHGHAEEALECFEKMRSKGLSLDTVTYMCILKACGSIGAVEKGAQIHDEIWRQGLLTTNVVLCNALVDMYAKCGDFAKAEQVLFEIPARNVVTWTTLMAGYVQWDQGEQALDCFDRMRQECISPNQATFICALQGCGIVGATDKGRDLHFEISRLGMGNDVVLGTALLVMYAKCGVFTNARRVLDELPVRNMISWSALITEYARQDRGVEALSCFKEMQSDGLCPNAMTFTCILNACGSIEDLEKGENIHDEILRHGLLSNNIVLGTALVDMYAKCGALQKARQVLEELPERDVVSWNVLIAVYVHEGLCDEAFVSFDRMQQDGCSPDMRTFVCILKACGIIGAPDKGEQIHNEIVRRGLQEDNIMLGTVLIDMYAKCGALAKAAELLEELPLGDIVSWSALIVGYAEQGHGGEALNCFEWMQHKGISPDAITFFSVLRACSHSGLEREGEMFFENMITKFGIKPDLEHLTCMVDLFGHAGHLSKAVEVIQMMPSFQHPTAWRALLSACEKWGDVNVGRWAFEQAIRIDETDGAIYSCMARTYRAAGMQEDAAIIEAVRVENKTKNPI